MPKINENINKIPFYLTKKVAEGVTAEPDVVNLSRGQAGFLPPKEIYEEAKRIADPADKTYFRYDKVAGNLKLRKAMSEWYKRQFDLEVDPKHIAITVGGTGGIILSMLCLTNPGDTIIIPDPSYPFYSLFGCYGLGDRNIKRLHIGSDRITRENLSPVIDDRTTSLILTNPHNPNGIVYDEDTLEGIVELAKEKDFFIVCDENHFPEIYDGRKHIPLAKLDSEGCVVLGSLSRYALQGERIGWAILPDKPDRFLEKYVALTPFTATSSQKLAIYFFESFEKLNWKKYFDEYEEKRGILVPALNNIEGFECKMPEGTSYAFPNINKFYEKNKEGITRFVKEEMKKRNLSQDDIETSLKYKSIIGHKFILYSVGVGSVPGIAYGPDSDNYLRFTFSVEKDLVEEAVKRFKEIPKYL